MLDAQDDVSDLSAFDQVWALCLWLTGSFARAPSPPGAPFLPTAFPRAYCSALPTATLRIAFVWRLRRARIRVGLHAPPRAVRCHAALPRARCALPRRRRTAAHAARLRALPFTRCRTPRPLPGLHCRAARTVPHCTAPPAVPRMPALPSAALRALPACAPPRARFAAVLRLPSSTCPIVRTHTQRFARAYHTHCLPVLVHRRVAHSGATFLLCGWFFFSSPFVLLAAFLYLFFYLWLTFSAR